jgi:hypothetical protein
MSWRENWILGRIGKLDQAGSPMPCLYCASKNVAIRFSLHKNHVASSFDETRHQSPGRGLADEVTDQIRRQVLCWRDLLGNSGSAAERCLGWVVYTSGVAFRRREIVLDGISCLCAALQRRASLEVSSGSRSTGPAPRDARQMIPPKADKLVQRRQRSKRARSIERRTLPAC